MAAAAPTTTDDYAAFLALHEAQLQAIAVPVHLWPSLHAKLSREVFDAGSYFQLAKDEDGDLHAVVLQDIDPSDDPNAIFLIDHAWTFTTDNNKPRDMLTNVPSLLGRMENLMHIAVADAADIDARIHVVLQTMWKFVNSYRLGHLKPEEAATIWYVMDEFGSAIEHSDDPTFRMAPFYYANAQCAFSLLWPTDRVEAHDFATLNYVAARDDDTLTALCSALFYPDGQAYSSELAEIVARRRLHHSDSHLHNETQFNRDNESVPTETASNTNELPTPIKIWTDLKLMFEHLTDPRFEFTDNEAEAHVVWPTRHIKDYVALYNNPNVHVFNQFPNEKILTCKDLLYETCRRANNNQQPPYMALTFNMETEFPELMQEYIRRDQAGLDNVWICKPWNLARSLDTEIATTSAQLAKLAQTGPKVACKYITKPFLIKQRKFDFRFLVMLVDTEPLTLYVSGVYWLRIANNPFTMDRFDDFQTHFTVMNYTDFGVEIISVAEFEAQFKLEYPLEDWDAVKADIFKSIRSLFEAATASPPPLGLGKSKKSRALYGVDVMLEWTDDGKIHPVILETNFHPDCTRACKYFKDFYNDLLNVLVLNNPDAAVHGITKL
ncbi:hypothetical protein H257_01631 [Aphanomyces astaci]|uniref:Tubulin--tyrosine ligase-like protein 12 SET-like domain-containing protein n=2 Tax=Aphanomyces astaci TaxID=112090 RepID=W4H331_APHAT|nr:hypothetical protein H257_01631 [Aphanomyces astaci]ETV86435.1 hypothetical protein H257_01631 [Aphanomyces astaci]|eukprot:XP_009823234.1 hypothetical protein H257_01631 [Aphanomyces astaci]